jgi:hypothetical protein
VKIVDRQTIFSPCRTYRYTLWRQWDMYNPSYAMFIGLNPSTADEVQDDPTVRRCIGFAKAWRFGALCMTNAFAFRATNPDVMKADPSPVGSDNDHWLVEMAKDAVIVIAAWGVHGAHHGRDVQVARLIKKLHCLGVTKDGHPKHPLYLRRETVPIRYNGGNDG